MLNAKRILNFTLINHPILDETIALAALSRFQQAVEETWGPGSAASYDRLSPAAQRWRAEFLVRDPDTASDRSAWLHQVVAQLTANLRREPLSVETGLALCRSQLIYSGMVDGQVDWGVTVTLSGTGMPQINEQQRHPSNPVIVSAPKAWTDQLVEMVEAATHPSESSAVLAPRRPRLSR